MTCDLNHLSLDVLYKISLDSFSLVDVKIEIAKRRKFSSKCIKKTMLTYVTFGQLLMEGSSQHSCTHYVPFWETTFLNTLFHKNIRFIF